MRRDTRYLITAIMLWQCSPSGDEATGTRQAADAGASGQVLPAPDLRFKWVDTGLTYQLRWVTNVDDGGGSSTFEEPGGFSPLQIPLGGSPASVGPGDHAVTNGNAFESWRFAFFTTDPQVEPLHSHVAGGTLDSLDADLARLLAQHELITSLDIAAAEAARGAYAFISVRPASETPLFRNASHMALQPDQLAEHAAYLGAGGRVITALAGDGQQLTVLAFDYVGDAKTYETRVERADLVSLPDKAQALAEAGYVITACGRNMDTLFLIGTRARGAPEKIYTIEVARDPYGAFRTPGVIVAWVASGEQMLMIVER